MVNIQKFLHSFFSSIIVTIAHSFLVATDHTNLLQLPFTLFDQTPSQGWRSVAAAEAPQLIQYHIDSHNDTLGADQIGILHFHAGQLQAFSQERQAAVDHFKKSYDSFLKMHQIMQPEPLHAQLLYIQATIAFLEKDLEILRGCEQELREKHQNTVGNNAEKVARLLKYHDRPYEEAYIDPQKPDTRNWRKA